MQPKVRVRLQPTRPRPCLGLRRGSAADASSELPVTPEQVLRTAMQRKRQGHCTRRRERAAKAQGLKDGQETPTSEERAKGLESGDEEQWSGMDLEVWNKFVLAGNDRFVQY